MGRTPRGYDGTRVPAHHLRDVLPVVVRKIACRHKERPDYIIAAWPSVVGPDLANMTRAVQFVDGILTVKVSNSTLLSLLSQYERQKLIKNLRQKFPRTEIKTIIFRIT